MAQTVEASTKKEPTPDGAAPAAAEAKAADQNVDDVEPPVETGDVTWRKDGTDNVEPAAAASK